MTSTLTPTCPFCGLRFDSRPLLELHVREDHAHLDRPAEAAQGGTDARTSGPRPNGPAGHGQSVAPSRAQEPVTTRNARRPGQPRTGRTAGVLRRVAGAFRRANAELLLAWEAMLRPAGAPRPPRPVGRLASDGKGGLWMTSDTHENHQVLLHYSAGQLVNANEAFMSVASIPGTAEALGGNATGVATTPVVYQYS